MSKGGFITLDDSELTSISYIGAGWKDETESVLPSGDRWFDGFHDKTYHDSYSDGDRMKVSWTGTGIVVKGTKRFK